MKRIFWVFVTLVILSPVIVRAEDCEAFADSKKYLSNNFMILKWAEEDADLCVKKFGGAVSALAELRDYIQKDLKKDPNNPTLKRLLDKTESDIMDNSAFGQRIAVMREVIRGKTRVLSRGMGPKRKMVI